MTDSFNPGASEPGKSEEPQKGVASDDVIEGDVGALVPKGMVVTRLNVRDLRRSDIPSYSQIKSSFSSEVKKSVSRFHVSEYVRSQLSVEEEELQLFEKRVEEEVSKRIAELSAAIQKEGFEKGAEEGRAKAYEEKKVEIEKELSDLRSAVSSVDMAKSSLSTKYQKQLAELAMKLAEILLHYDFKNSPELISHTIVEMLDRISKDDDVVIRLSKEYSGLIDKIREVVAPSDSDATRRVQFELSEELRPGDAIVECMSGEVASYLDQKIELLRAKLLENVDEVQ